MLRHLSVIFVSLFLFLGIPLIRFGDISLLTGGEPDASAGASMIVPDQPSGEFYVLLNTEKHKDTLEQWKLFFFGEDAGVILSDISCMAARTDRGGVQLAERYRARLPENQMKLETEDVIMLSSMVEVGRFDAVVMSKEAADACRLRRDFSGEGMICIPVKGDGT